jgi:hypothetical protein
MQRQLYKKMQDSIKLLTFLKWQSDTHKHGKKRFMNIILVTLKMLYPIVLLFVLMLTNSQESKFSMIIKSYGTLGIVSTMD